MIKVAVVAGGDLDVLMTDVDLFVGVDAGARILLQHHLLLELG